MIAYKVLALTFLFVCVNSRHVFNTNSIPLYIIDTANLEQSTYEDLPFEHPYHLTGHERDLSRVRRQIHGSVNTSPDGTTNLNARLPLAQSDSNSLSALGFANSKGVGGGGLALDNVNGHGLSVTGRHIPDFGNQVTGAGKLNLFHNDNHNLNANAFITRNMPSNPNIPSFNTKGGSLDYMFKDKIGGSLGMSHTGLIDRTDYSAMGNLNLYRGRDSSLDFTGGYSKSVSPYIPHSSWQPSAGLSFTKYW